MSLTIPSLLSSPFAESDKFCGDPGLYLPWRKKLIKSLIAADPQDLGLLGAFVSTSEYEKHSKGRPYMALQHNQSTRPDRVSQVAGEKIPDALENQRM